MRTQELFKFIKARHDIYLARERGEPKPWTKDPILQKYRFCNVHRENDKVTQWIADNWRGPHSKDPDLWFAMAVARLINLPSSLKELSYPVPWKPEKFQRILRAKKERGETTFSAAYMIRADAKEGWLKTDYLAECVLNPMWKNRETIRPRNHDSLFSFCNRLLKYRDIGNFIAGQIIADTKFHGQLKKAGDWWTWAVMGPGSSRGMTRVMGGILRRVKNGSSELRVTNQEKTSGKPHQEFAHKGIFNDKSWFLQLGLLQKEIDPLIKKAGILRLSAQDLQNCLCEFDKYERVRLGEGRPKQLYPGV